MTRRITRPLALAVLSLGIAQAASAAPPAKRRTAKVEAAPRRAPPGQSVGSPTAGHLVGGAHLMESSHVRIVPFYAPGDARWGLEALVGMLDRSARAVRKQFPDAVLSVGHLSRPGGGPIDRHASHESGRDADVAFYVKNLQGKPIAADHFVPFRGDGTAPTWPGARFDDARNWALVASFVSDPQAKVTHIFVATPLRARLLQHAERIGAPPALRARAAEAMLQPRGALPHDDHFHVRIGCPSGMEKCVEIPLKKHGGVARGAPKRPTPSAPATAATPTTSARGVAAQAKPTPPPPARREEKDDDSFVPSLAPIVPGLDAAIIPAPLAGLKHDAPAPERDSEPDLAPIDDPDGVLEKH